MNKSIYLLAVLFFLSLNTAYGQDTSEEMDDGKGLYIGLSLIGTSFDVPEFSDDMDTGGGLGLEIGYNFSTNFAIFANLDGSNMSPDVGEDYGLAHVDLGVEGRLGDSDSSFRPFAKASLLAAVAQYDGEQGDLEISGGGLGLGIGVYYFVNDNFALDLGYTHSWINVSEVKVGSVSVEIDENAQSGRIGLGFSYHF